MLLAVVLAGIVAACNRIAADRGRHPQSGGGYVYGSARLCSGAGRLARVAFLVGKSASAAAADRGVRRTSCRRRPGGGTPGDRGHRAEHGGRALDGAAPALVGGTLAVLLVVVVVVSERRPGRLRGAAGR
jgi:APA family basic amino acid/polyamine antiporter